MGRVKKAVMFGVPLGIACTGIGAGIGNVMFESYDTQVSRINTCATALSHISLAARNATDVAPPGCKDFKFSFVLPDAEAFRINALAGVRTDQENDTSVKTIAIYTGAFGLIAGSIMGATRPEVEPTIKPQPSSL